MEIRGMVVEVLEKSSVVPADLVAAPLENGSKGNGKCYANKNKNQIKSRASS